MTKQYLFLLQPTPVAWGVINGSWSEEYPTLEIPITGVSTIGGADFVDVVKPGQTIIFGSTAGGDDLGRNRIRRVFDATSVLIARSSQGVKDGEVSVEAGDHFTIWDDYRVWGKPPWIHDDGLEFKDGDFLFASHGEGVEFYPVANTGPGFADVVDPDTGVITVEFPGEGAASFSTPAGVGITDYLWDIADGTVIAGAVDAASVTATFPPGFRWVSLTVTDTNNMEHTARCPVIAEDPDDSICVDLFQIVGHERTKEGQRIQALILSEIPRSTYPDGTLMVYWRGSPSAADDRSHMQFIGWHHGDEASIQRVKTGTLRDTILEGLDVAGKLDTIAALPQILAHAAEPTKWSEMYQADMVLWWHYLLYWHSTALEVADYFPVVDFSVDFPFVRRAADADTLWRQVATQVKACCPDRILMCNRWGQIAVRIDWNTFPVSTRTSTVQADLEGYIESIRFPHLRPPRVGWIRGSAVLAQNNTVPTTVDVQYTIHATAQFLAGATSIDVDPIPVALPAGAQLVYSYAQTEVTSAPASLGATTLSMVALTDTVDVFQDATVTVQEDGPEFIPTLFAIAPGLAPGQGAQHLNSGNRIAVNQGGLNSAIGMLYARLNAEYGIAEIDVADDGALMIDPGMGYWVETGDMAARYVPQRALPYFPCRGLAERVTIEYLYHDGGVVAVTRLTFERESSGPSALTVEGNV